jgi:hypothetical protein
MKGRESLVLQRVMLDISNFSQNGKKIAANESFIPTFFTSRLKRERDVVRSPQSNDPPSPPKRKHHSSLRNYFHSARVSRTTRRPNLISGI